MMSMDIDVQEVEAGKQIAIGFTFITTSATEASKQATRIIGEYLLAGPHQGAEVASHSIAYIPTKRKESEQPVCLCLISLILKRPLVLTAKAGDPLTIPVIAR